MGLQQQYHSSQMILIWSAVMPVGVLCVKNDVWALGKGSVVSSDHLLYIGSFQKRHTLLTTLRSSNLNNRECNNCYCKYGMDNEARIFFSFRIVATTNVPKRNVARLFSISIYGASVTKCHHLPVILCVYDCKWMTFEFWLDRSSCF